MTPLPKQPLTYQKLVEDERNRTLSKEMRLRQRTDNDYEIGNNRLILTSPDGTRWSMTVDNAGNPVFTSL